MQGYSGQEIGNYRLIKIIEANELADSYLGIHALMQVEVLIKLFHRTLENHQKEIFYSQARRLTRLVHPQILRTLEFGIKDMRPFLVFDYVPGKSLRQQHPLGSILPIATVTSYTTQIAYALQYAHEHGVLHRDIRPENILIGADGKLLLSGFVIDLTDPPLQSSQLLSAITVYTAPEQLQGSPVPASDQYSLAAVAYEWLTGSLPFSGSFVEIATHQTLTPPPSLREKVPDLSAHIEAVILKALAKDATQRFASIQEFATAFEQACRPDGAVDVTNVTIDLFSSDTAPLPALPQTSAMNVLPIQETTITTYRGHTAAVKAVAWEPHELHPATFYRSRIASASDDGTIQIWEAETGRKI